jgi:1-acyl-sn-glycerol-3-phosphate acyltransferase
MTTLSNIIKFIRVILALLFFLAFVSTFLLIAVLTWRRFTDQLSGPMLRFWGRGTLMILGVPLRLVGDWPFRDPQPRVCILNHQSTLDIVWFCAVSPNRMSGVGKVEIKKVPVLNVAWWVLKLYYIDRSNRESAVQTLLAVSEDIIKNKRSVTLAPEGTRSATAQLGPFKKGAFHLALNGKLPIYPMVVAGAYEAMPKGRLLATTQPISVRFLPPISTLDWMEETLDEHIEEVRSIMESAYHQLRHDMGLPETSTSLPT